MSPARRRDAVTHLEDAHGVSERRACKVTGQHRGTQRYCAEKQSDEDRLVQELHRLVQAYPRRGYRHMTTLLRQAGWRVNTKRVHRLWQQEGFKVMKKRQRKRAVGDAVNACHKRVASSRNDVWTWDFIHDRTVDGRQLKCLVILDEYTRECLCLDLRHAFKTDTVLELLSQSMARYGMPRHLRSDNGSEFIAGKMRAWLRAAGVETLYIEPGAPWQNGYAESFNSRLRDEFLEMNYFYSLAEAQFLARTWQETYNHKRPQRALGNVSPAQFAACCPAPGCAALRAAPPRPVQQVRSADPDDQKLS